VTTLSRADLEATLGFLRQAGAVTGPDPFPSELLDRLRVLVPSDFVSYCELDEPGRFVVAYEACGRGRELDASQPDEELLPAFWRFMHEHPLCAYQARTGDFTACKFSDFVTRRQWHRLGLYAEYFRFYGVEERMVVGLPTRPGHSKVVALDRGCDRDFGERDRLLLNVLRPHLVALDASARARRLAAVVQVEPDGAAVVVLQSLNQVDFATTAATRMLARYFDGTSDGRLPETVRAWLRDDSRRLNGDGLPPPSPAPLRVERGDRRLTIRRAGRALLLDEEVATLTRRERDVVDQLARGRSNTEIAERLMVAPTTVRKHLENIYAKLGVNTRTAAIAAIRLETECADPVSAQRRGKGSGSRSNSTSRIYR
jgi:DNA-binding CsgD family transcriptional regulator